KLASGIGAGAMACIYEGRIYQGVGTNEEKPDEQEQAAEQRISFSTDRRENPATRRLARQDAEPTACVDQASRSRGRRGMEMERGTGLVTRRIDLHRRDLQERREDDLRQRGGFERSFAPLQLQA